MSYRPDNFTIQELAHPQILNDIGEDNAWLRLDEDCLWDLQYIRNEWFMMYGSGVYVNRIDLGLDSRGLRPPNDKDGAFYSTHKQGTTFDLEPVNGLIETFFLFVADLITRGELKKINTLEDFQYTKRWVHAGYMNTGKKLLIIKP